MVFQDAWNHLFNLHGNFQYRPECWSRVPCIIWIQPGTWQDREWTVSAYCTGFFQLCCSGNHGSPEKFSFQNLQLFLEGLHQMVQEDTPVTRHLGPSSDIFFPTGWGFSGSKSKYGTFHCQVATLKTMLPLVCGVPLSRQLSVKRFLKGVTLS